MSAAQDTLAEDAARSSSGFAPAHGSESACKTPEQHLKGIFQKLDAAEKLQEPERTNQLRRMIKIALDDLEWVKMPNVRDERP